MLATNKQGDALVIRPDCPFVSSRLDELRTDLQALINGGEARLVIDLDGADTIDSKGLALLIQCHKSLAQRGGALTLVTRNDDFKQLFKVMRLNEHLTIVDSL